MGWNLYDDGYGTVEVYCTLQPIRSRHLHSLEHQMRELIIKADAFKAQLKAAEIQTAAYKAGIASLQDTYKLITDIN